MNLNPETQAAIDRGEFEIWYRAASLGTGHAIIEPVLIDPSQSASDYAMRLWISGDGAPGGAYREAWSRPECWIRRTEPEARAELVRCLENRIAGADLQARKWRELLGTVTGRRTKPEPTSPASAIGDAYEWLKLLESLWNSIVRAGILRAEAAPENLERLHGAMAALEKAREAA